MLKNASQVAKTYTANKYLEELVGFGQAEDMGQRLSPCCRQVCGSAVMVSKEDPRLSQVSLTVWQKHRSEQHRLHWRLQRVTTWVLRLT